MTAPIEEFPQVSNFAASDVITDDEVTEYLKSAIPFEHLRGCLGIQYFDDVLFDAKTGSKTRGLWEGIPYLGNCCLIKIFSHKDLADFVLGVKEQIKKTLVHEVGHQAYNNLLWPDTKLIQEWERLYDCSIEDGKVGTCTFISDYAKQDSCEDFAESYKNLVMDDGDLLCRVNEPKYHFMTKIFSSTSQTFSGGRPNPSDVAGWPKEVINLSRKNTQEKEGERQ